MGIDGIGPIKEVGGLGEISKTKKTGETKEVRKDRLSLSTEGKEKVLYEKAFALIKETPDIRQDKVAEIRRQMADASYDNDARLEKTTSNLLRSLGLGD